MTTSFLFLATLFLGAAVIIVPLFQRLGLGSVLGYLVAGVAIAPVLRWLGADAVQISHIAEFGVVMMLFLVGLELEPKKLWRLRVPIVGIGGAQVLITATNKAGLVFESLALVDAVVALVAQKRRLPGEQEEEEAAAAAAPRWRQRPRGCNF